MLFLNDGLTILVCDPSRPIYLVYHTNFSITPQVVGPTGSCVPPPPPPPTLDVKLPGMGGSGGAGGGGP